MMQQLGRRFIDFLAVLALGTVLALPQAHAGMIGTDAARAQDERARVKALLERPELSQGLEKRGIAPQEALARVDAMSDAEVLQLAGRLDAAVAGAQISNESLLLIIIIILLIIIVL